MKRKISLLIIFLMALSSINLNLVISNGEEDVRPKEKIDIRFDLKDSVPPADNPNIFNDRESEGVYCPLDHIPKSEFQFFRDVKPVKAGYKLDGWKWYPCDSHGEYNPDMMNDLWDFDDDAQYFPGFMFIPNFVKEGEFKATLEFDLHEGTAPLSNPDIFDTRETMNLYQADAMIPLDEFAFFRYIHPSKKGHEFRGWRFECYDDEGNLEYESSPYEKWKFNIDHKFHHRFMFHAMFEKVEKRRTDIEFNLEGAHAPDDNPYIFKNRKTNNLYFLDQHLPPNEFQFFKGIEPIKKGFEFKGWKYKCYDERGDLKYNSYDSTWDFTQGCENFAKIVFTPLFEGIRFNMKLEFDLNGGYAPEGYSDTFKSRQTENLYILNQEVPSTEFAFFKNVIPLRDGYYFKGWKVYDITEGGSLGKFLSTRLEDYWDFDEGCNAIYGKVFVADWGKLTKENAKLTFDLDGGKAPSENEDIFDNKMTQDKYYEGQKIKKEEFSYFKNIKPIRKGYEFLGWNFICYNSHDMVVFDSGKDSYWEFDKDFDMYYRIEFIAKWDEKPGLNPVNIEFDLGSGKAPSNNVRIFDDKLSKYLYNSDDNIASDEFLYFKDIEPLNLGFKFKGWKVKCYDELGNISFDGTSEYFDFNREYKYCKRIVFIADWQEDIVNMNITFDLDGGNAPDDNMDIFNERVLDSSYQVGANILTSEFDFFKDIIPIKSGYEFKGWYVKKYDEDGNLIEEIDSKYFDFDEEFKCVHQVEFIANWELKDDYDTCTFKFDLKGGSSPTDNPSIFDDRETKYAYLATENIPATETAIYLNVKPSKKGHDFKGWKFKCYDASGNETFDGEDTYHDFEDEIKYCNSIIFTADWEAKKYRMKIEFDLDGGNAPDDNQDIFKDNQVENSYDFGSEVPMNEMEYFKDIIPQKEGSKFNGWKFIYYDENDEIIYSSIDDEYWDFNRPGKSYYKVKFIANWKEPFKRYAGADRLKTAVEISRAMNEKTDNVVLAVATNFPDAMSGAPLAKKLNAPILLTMTDQLSVEARDEIKRLEAKNIYILGGVGAISKNVEDELNKMVDGDVIRIGGSSRIETSCKIAERLLQGENNKTAYVANALNFPDALAAGAIAASKGSPVLLTMKNTATVEMVDILKSYHINRISVAGGRGAISNGLYRSLKKLGKEITRNAGNNRFETAVEIAKNEKPDADRVYIATGLSFPDALTGSVLAAKEDGVVLLTMPGEIWPATDKYLDTKSDLDFIGIFGGAGAVSTSVEDVLKDILK